MANKLIGKILVWMGAVQFLIVMIPANWWKSQLRHNPTETFFGYPDWAAFVLVGISALVAMLFMTTGAMMIFGARQEEING